MIRLLSCLFVVLVVLAISRIVRSSYSKGRKCDAAHVKSEGTALRLLSSFLLSNEGAMYNNEDSVDDD